MATYTMEDMLKKYGDFTFPTYQLKINGKQIPQAYCNGDVEAELSADYEASGCKIRLYNAFVVENGKQAALAKDLSSLMKLGNKVALSIGYRDKELEQIFVGYIDALAVEYDKEDGICYILECLDGKGIMMNSLRSEVKVNMKKYSAVVEDTVKKYSAVVKVKNANLDKTDTEVGVPIEQHNESDYQFLVRLARKMDYCFYIENGNLVFQPYAKLPKDVFFSYHINAFLLSFYMHSSLKGQVAEVTVRTNNEKDPNTPFEAKVTSGKGIADNASIQMKSTSVITKDVSQTIIDLSADSEAAARNLAQARYNALSYGRYQGRIRTIGIPVMLPGRVVALEGFGVEFDKKYFVKKVIHRIANHRYITECELEGNQI